MSAVLEAREPSARYLETLEPALMRQFDLLAAAPGGVVRLRELLLTLAVQGKLVPQDPGDERAAALMERIRKGVAQLEDSGEAKRAKSLAPIERDDDPFALPPSWKWVPLGEAIEIIRGITFPASEKTREPAPGRIACLRTANVQASIEWGDLLFIARSFMGREEQLIQPDDIVMSMANSRELVGKVAIVEKIPHSEATFGGFLGVLRPRQIEPRYVMALLRTPYARTALIDSASQTTNIANVSLAKLRPLPFPLPPLAEQVRIVARVEELMRLCDALEAKGRLEATQHAQLLSTVLGTLTDSASPEELAANLQRVADHFDLLLDRPEAVDALEQTILQLAVRGLLVPQDPNDEPASVLLERIDTQRRRSQRESSSELAELDPAVAPYELPSQWTWAQLGDLVENMGSGWSPACEDGERIDPTRWAVLRTTAVQVMEYRAHEHKAIPLKFAPRPEIEVQPGDVLVTRAGPMNRVGISCWVDQTPSRLMLSDKIVRFHPVGDELSPAFVVMALNAGWTRELLEAAKTGMAASQVNVSQSDLKSLWIPVCSREEQLRIVTRVEELRRLCTALRQRLAARQTTQSHLADALVASASA